MLRLFRLTFPLVFEHKWGEDVGGKLGGWCRSRPFTWQVRRPAPSPATWPRHSAPPSLVELRHIGEYLRDELGIVRAIHTGVIEEILIGVDSAWNYGVVWDTDSTLS